MCLKGLMILYVTYHLFKCLIYCDSGHTGNVHFLDLILCLYWCLFLKEVSQLEEELIEPRSTRTDRHGIAHACHQTHAIGPQSLWEVAWCQRHTEPT